MEISAATDDFQKAANAIKAAGDGTLRTELTKALRDIAKPFAQFVLLKGAAELPKRGGLSYRVAGASISTNTSSTLRVTMTLTNKQGYALGAMNRGIIRHPVFNRTNAEGKREWVQQSIRSNLWTTPFNQNVPAIRAQLVAAANKVLQKVAT
jgi:hypothetical protein